MMSPRPDHHVVDVHREDHLWVAAVRDLAGAVTDVERLEDVDLEVRDMLHLLTGEPESYFELEWRFSQGGRDYTESVDALQHWEAEAAKALANRDRARLEVITTLRESGMSQRAIAEVVGTSHQRVAQLLAGTA
ncbi:MerR [Allosaccharopolyspora coralli]|uniref:MerR n=1 Tax=Allosaccharopolyspora coralli TaxID=2665642 RepID=A0A5Q3Q187_9PSEU|nr:MerR [Allosaccharopolyspora coralli]QGK68291.1 MerR [Allosaccharopolyspora coralli]